MATTKTDWQGTIIGVQPRIRLLRSFDERSHTYLGYVLHIDGTIGGERRVFSVAIGKAAQAKHLFRVGDVVSGNAAVVSDERQESAEFYKAARLKRHGHNGPESQSAPPWHTPPPDLETYRERGHRRLAARTYKTKCRSCVWGCQMPVEIIVDHWNPSQTRYRFETVCYGPKSCAFYKAGPTRKVPGRRGMTWEEEDWVDEDATAHRGEHE